MDNSIDVEKIMQDIRDEIARTGRDTEPLAFIDLEAAQDTKKDDLSLEESVGYISCNYEVQPFEVLRGNKIAVFFKRCIRKVTGFFILPIVRQQNSLNYHYYRIAETVTDLKEDNEELREIAKQLEKRVNALEKQKGGKE